MLTTGVLTMRRCPFSAPARTRKFARTPPDGRAVGGADGGRGEGGGGACGTPCTVSRSLSTTAGVEPLVGGREDAAEGALAAGPGEGFADGGGAGAVSA